MAGSRVLTTVALACVHLGAVLGFVGAWANANSAPSDGADIGAGIAVLAGILLFTAGVLLEILALSVVIARRRGPAGSGRVHRAS